MHNIYHQHKNKSHDNQLQKSSTANDYEEIINEKDLIIMKEQYELNCNWEEDYCSLYCIFDIVFFNTVF